MERNAENASTSLSRFAYENQCTFTSGHICIICFFALRIHSCLYEPPHPLDEKLIEIFYQHKGEFELLHQMLIQDNELIRVDMKWTMPENLANIHITSQRINEYRAIMKRLGIKSLSSGKNRHSVEFRASSRGMVTHGSSKGYQFEKEPIKWKGPREKDPIVDNLDRFSEHGTHWGLRHIEGDWYLYFISQ